MGKKEEISDMLDPKAFDDPNFQAARTKKDGTVDGTVLKFEKATIKVTKIDRKNKRAWGEHIVLVDQKTTYSHLGHNVDMTLDMPWCSDCEVPVNEPSTEDGEVKALNRKDSQLEDGTPIET